jgi:hypothetical protein
MVSFEANGRPRGKPGRMRSPAPVTGRATAKSRWSWWKRPALAPSTPAGFLNPGGNGPARRSSSPTLTHEEMGPALASAERHRIPKRRELFAQVFAERVDEWASRDAETVVKIARALFE